MSTPSPISDDILDALRLIRSDGVGPVAYRRLVDRFGSAGNALSAMPNMPKPITPFDAATAKRELDALHKMGGRFLVASQFDYPDGLKHVPDAPPVLAALGNMELLTKPMIAIVGARNASANGRKLAATMARDLGAAGYVVVSGLARGIDTAAHDAALDTGTIAVLANGVDIAYPPENRKLYDAVRERGLILSENALGVEPNATLFPRRNRIISALGRGVIVIEAAEKSGSLITARCALDQGREVFAVPGSPADPRASGPNRLIKNGNAHLVESAEDVLNILGGLKTWLREDRAAFETDFEDDDAVLLDNAPSMTNDQMRMAVFNCLGADACTIDQIAFTTRVPVKNILAILMEMELDGVVTRMAGDRVARAA